MLTKEVTNSYFTYSHQKLILENNIAKHLEMLNAELLKTRNKYSVHKFIHIFHKIIKYTDCKMFTV